MPTEADAAKGVDVKRGSNWIHAIVALTLIAGLVLVLAATWVFSSSWDRCVASGDDSNRVTSCSDSKGAGRGLSLSRA